MLPTPGITNVTDRARYYSFGPWLIRSFEQRYADHSVDAFRRVLRRAECLFELCVGLLRAQGRATGVILEPLLERHDEVTGFERSVSGEGVRELGLSGLRRQQEEGESGEE